MSPGKSEREELERIAGATPASEPGYKVPSGSVPDRAELLANYAAVAPLMLPHIEGRPLNLFRCHGRYCFFQRNRRHPKSQQSFDEPIRKIPIRQKNGRTEDYLFVDSGEGLLACIAADAVEFHAWGSRVPDVEKPDRIAIDLNPGEGATFAMVRDAAFQVRRSLEAIGLESWPLLTGGKGVHVVIRFVPEAGWDVVRRFAKTFCQTLAEADPERFTVSLPKECRRGRIFLDYLRNQRTATAIMPYSLRARPGTPVAAPVDWKGLEDLRSSAAYLIGNVTDLVRRARGKSLRQWGTSEQQLPLLG